MKKFTYILSLIAVTAILFTGCYTQLATRDRDYSGGRNQQPTYGGNQGDYGQYQGSTYDDSSEYYGDNYYDSTGYYDDSSAYYEDRGSSGSSDYNYGNSPYYYDDFYYTYPSYRRYFWGYQPSIVIGFSWNSYAGPFCYDPFYYNYWYSWYYPGSWSCLPFNYYYPSPYYFGFNYYGGGFHSFTHNYYTYRERTQDIRRIRNLDGLRGRDGRSPLIGSRDGNTGRNLTERKRGETRLSPTTRTSTDRISSGRVTRETTKEGQRLRRPVERKSPTGNFDQRRTPPRINSRNESGKKENRRINPYLRRNNSPDIQKHNEGRKTNGNVRPRSYTPPRREYNPPKRDSSPKQYSPPQRNNSPRNSTPPRSYSPPQRSSNPPSSHSSGSRSGGSRSSSGQGRR